MRMIARAFVVAVAVGVAAAAWVYSPALVPAGWADEFQFLISTAGVFAALGAAASIEGGLSKV